MATHKKIVQYAPDPTKPDTPWAYGWGFDSNGFRVVMFAPKCWDHPVVADIARSMEGVHRRGEEHGPAHIHVIDKQNGKESKFELVEHFDSSEHRMRLMKPEGHSKTPLTDAQIDAVLPILKEYTPDFIQLWREFFQNTRLSNYVTRISEKYPNCRERIFFDDHKEKYIELKDLRTEKTAVMPFDQYVLTQGHHRK